MTLKTGEAKAKAIAAAQDGTLGMDLIHINQQMQKREIQAADIRDGIMSSKEVHPSQTNPGIAFVFRGLAEKQQITIVVGFDLGYPDVVTAWWGHGEEKR